MTEKKKRGRPVNEEKRRIKVLEQQVVDLTNKIEELTNGKAETHVAANFSIYEGLDRKLYIVSPTGKYYELVSWHFKHPTYIRELKTVPPSSWRTL